MALYHEVRKRYGGADEPPYYVVHSGGQILALCLRVDFNPYVTADPAEVWVGAEQHVAAWGEKLAFHTKTVPVWLSQGAGLPYQELGNFSVIGSTDAPADLLTASRTPGVGKLSRIVYLKKLVPLVPHAACS